MARTEKYDVVIVGAGHNGLVSACYLAKAGLSVLMLERNDYVGGATTSQKVFEDYEASLSRYSYLVSLFPQQIIKDLDLRLNLRRRKTASYTPYFQDSQLKGLLLSNESEWISHQSVINLGFGESEWEGYQAILQKQTEFASLVWDAFLEPLKTAEDWKQLFERKGKSDLWHSFVERPIGELIENHVKSDVLRGVLLTDAKIGSFTSAHDESLLQNRTFIYHVIGNKTGEWRVPEGGMGSLSEQLKKKALDSGVTIKINSQVAEIAGENEEYRVSYHDQGNPASVWAKYVLLNSAHGIEQLFNHTKHAHQRTDEGTAFKINVLLSRLPALKDKSLKPEDAFAGTFHINQSYAQLQTAYEEAHSQKIPETFPFEIYCHTLTDPSILSEELQTKGFHTFTAFGLDMAYPLFEKDNEAAKEIVLQKFFKGINSFLEEPLENSIARDNRGNLCIEAKSALDLENALKMPRGNIFHQGLSWFFAETPEEAGQWGVETEYPNVYLCGSSAKRGGAVSGIPGRNAAMKVLEKK